MNITSHVSGLTRHQLREMVKSHMALVRGHYSASGYGFCKHHQGVFDSYKPHKVRNTTNQSSFMVDGRVSSSVADNCTYSVPSRTYGVAPSSNNLRLRTSLNPSRTTKPITLQLQDVMGLQRRDFMNLFGSSQQTEWARAVSEAEKIVGYSTSFMSLRCLLSDELANVALHMRKLVGTKHPLLKTAKNFLTDGKHTLQTRGLIILLMSKAGNASTHKAPQDTKAGNASTNITPQDSKAAGGIYASQRALAEISEMIHTAFLVHQGVINLLDLDPAIGPIRVMELGNKMAVLSGDFLLASACKALAGLRNTVVVELISKAIAHLTEAAFMPFRNPDSSPVMDLQPDLTFPDWEKYVYLSSGTLIAHSCRGALELTNHSPALTECAFDFGKNIAWAQQLHTELQPFVGNSAGHGLGELSLTSAPVILYLEGKREQQEASSTEFSSFDKPNIRKLVRAIRRSEAVDKARDLCHRYADSALQALSTFPPSDSRTALQNMIYAVRT